MNEWRLTSDKWVNTPYTPLMGMVEERLFELLESRASALLAKFGSWTDVVTDHTHELLTEDDCRAIDQSIRDTGYRYEWAAQISRREFPDKYRE